MNDVDFDFVFGSVEVCPGLFLPGVLCVVGLPLPARLWAEVCWSRFGLIW